MGPAGAGKTTVGELLASQLGWEFADGDSFHSSANIKKMSRGEPLTDQDRLPWLQAIREVMVRWEEQGQNGIMACSALKGSYRETLRIDSSMKLVYLKGAYELLHKRLRSRKGHYAGAQLLASQLADLEEPADAITIDASLSPEKIAVEIRKQLGLP